MKVEYVSCTIGATKDEVTIGLFVEGNEDSCISNAEFRIPKEHVRAFCNLVLEYAKPFPLVHHGRSLVEHLK